MVKVSFNSALAQKEAAKKEEENSQVLILPPDAKVRAEGGPTFRSRPRRRRALCSAPLRSAGLAGEGSAAGTMPCFVRPLPAAMTRGPAGGKLRSGAPRRPIGSRF